MQTRSRAHRVEVALSPEIVSCWRPMSPGQVPLLRSLPLNHPRSQSQEKSLRFVCLHVFVPALSRGPHFLGKEDFFQGEVAPVQFLRFVSTFLSLNVDKMKRFCSGFSAVLATKKISRTDERSSSALRLDRACAMVAKNNHSREDYCDFHIARSLLLQKNPSAPHCHLGQAEHFSKKNWPAQVFFFR